MPGAREQRYQVVTQARAALILTFSLREKEQTPPLPHAGEGWGEGWPQMAV